MPLIRLFLSVCAGERGVDLLLDCDAPEIPKRGDNILGPILDFDGDVEIDSDFEIDGGNWYRLEKVDQKMRLVPVVPLSDIECRDERELCQFVKRLHEIGFYPADGAENHVRELLNNAD